VKDEGDLNLGKLGQVKRGAVVGSGGDREQHPVEGNANFPRGGKVTIVLGEDGKPKAEVVTPKKARKRLATDIDADTKAILDRVKNARGLPFGVAVDAAVAAYWEEYK